MAQLMWAVLCSRLIIDQETNQATYVDLIQSLRPKSLPTNLPRVILATTWKRDESNETPLVIRVSLTDPDGKRSELFEAEPVTFGDALFWRVNFDLRGLEITSSGVHTVTVSTKPSTRWRKEFEIPLTILRPEA